MPGLSADLAHFEVVEFHLIEKEGPDLLAVDLSFRIQDLLVRQDVHDLAQDTDAVGLLLDLRHPAFQGEGPFQYHGSVHPAALFRVQSGALEFVRICLALAVPI